MPDTCRSGRLPPRSVVDTHKHITDTCKHFANASDVEYGKFALASLDAALAVDINFVLLLAIGVDVVNHVRAGGGFVLTDPPAQPEEGEENV